MVTPQGQKTRRYVDVIARWRDDGRIEPLMVCWPDGRSFQVDEVIGSPASDTFSGAPVHTQRYTVRIGGRVTHLYLERRAEGKGAGVRWFVEARPGFPTWSFGRLSS